MKQEVQNKTAQGTDHTVLISLNAAHRPQRAQLIARQQLKDSPPMENIST